MNIIKEICYSNPNNSSHATLVQFDQADKWLVCTYILDTYADLEDKDFFSINDLDASISKLLDSHSGLLYGLLDDDRIIALQGVEFDNFVGVYKLSCSEPSRINASEIGWALVSSKYRGHRLANILTVELENDAWQLHGCTKFIATIHPYNSPSLRAFFRMGYLGYSIVFFNQLPRVILAKNIFPQLSYPPSIELVEMGPFSFEKIASLFSEGYLWCGIDGSQHILCYQLSAFQGKL